MQLPPGIQTFSLLQTLELIVNPIRFFDKYRQRYGDTFTAKILGLNSPPVVFLGNPEAVQAVFTAEPGQFELGKVTHVFRPLTGDKSLIMLDGERHRRQRKLLMPPLHGDRIKTYGELICQLTQEAIANLPHHTPFTIRAPMSDISLEVILRVVFGIQPGDRYQQLKHNISSLLEAITNPIYSSFFFFPPLQKDLGSWSPWGHFVRRKAEIDRLIYAEISERRQQNYQAKTDILSLLMSAEDENGEQMTDIELRDQLLTLLFLGHETTASSLAWAFYWLYHLPHIRQKLQQEIAELGTNYTPEELVSLPYLNAVCQETLRLYPIALISQPRIVKKPLTTQGITYQKGTILIPCIYLAHHRSESFPDSHTFQPERFLERKVSPFEHFPFGGGSRGCIGMALSLYEMKLLLGTMLAQLQLELDTSVPVKPVRRGITIVPTGGKFKVTGYVENKQPVMV
ncbi:MAG: cytochrome P450 [Jaaginema sp. PMC 1079.18]|nr:cytochrome P450 [Jaaginema sp. PMC 1080.18]MEC4853274.1 cytochrome P450 [Jaaginema sp. PMC 1079.18]MEC4867979.1 cytochrome P450 [Jaaginema sp. PMC 1078.18]